MFEPKQFDKGKVKRLPVTASQTLTKFQHVKFSSGYIVTGAAGDNEAEYIMLQDAASLPVGTLVEVIPVDDVIVFHALTSITPVQATHVGNDYDFAGANSIDLGSTTDKVFHIDRIISAADKIVEGRFNKPALA